MKKTLIILITLALAPIWVQGQEHDKNKKQDKDKERWERIVDTNQEETGDSGPRNGGETMEVGELKDDSNIFTPAARHFPDVSNYQSVCYEKIVNQFGFWKGIGKPLTEKEMSHHPYYYRLLRPQNASPNTPFTHMQIVDHSGHPYAGLTYEPYIGESDGSNVSFDDVAQAEKIFWQGCMVQENMYAADGTLITQFIVTPLSENEVIGHFINPNGIMPRVRDEEAQTYIYIKYDDNGFVSQIAFYNENGTMVKNGDDAYMKLFVNDEQGNQLCSMSGDASGNPIIDNWGNCGYRYTYDSKTGRCLTATCINQFGEPMNMPSSKSSSQGVCKTVYSYDLWGNPTSSTFFDNNDERATDKYGVHRYLSKYNNIGLMTSYRAENPSWHLVNYSGSIAMITTKYDKSGNMTFQEFRNEDSLFTTEDDCLWIRRYKNGKCTLRLDYNSNTGTDTVLNYKMVNYIGGDTIWDVKNGFINVESFDAKGRMCCDAYYDLNGNPILHHGYHKIVYNYTDSYLHSIREIRYLGTDDKLADIHNEDYIHQDRYNVLINEVDSVNRIKTITELDGNKILDKYANQKNEDYSATTAIMYYDSIGIRGRTFKSDGFFYKMERVIDGQGNTYAWQAVNEFGEPSYNMTGDWNDAAIYSLNIVDETNFRDENGDTIPRNSNQLREFKNGLYKAFCIELIDTIALNYGLMTGDFIVQYGDWVYVNPRTNGGYWRNILCYETVLKATTEKKIVVMRHDPIAKTSQLIELNLPVGTPQQLGFLYHMMYMTKAETERYENVIAKGLELAVPDNINTTEALPLALHLSSTNCDFDENDRIDFLFPDKIGRRTLAKVFHDGFKQNVIVLGWEPYLNGTPHFFGCNNPDENIDDAFTRSCDSMMLYYTVDGQTVLKYTFTDNDFVKDIKRSNTRIPDASAIYALADSLQTLFTQRNTPKLHAPSMKPHEAAEQLLRLNGSEKSSDSHLYLWLYDEFTNLSDIYEVSFNTDSLSFDEIQYARSILSNIDLTDYTYLEYINDDEESVSDYVMVNKGKITEIVRVKENSIFFFIGNGIGIPHKTIPTITANNDKEGYFKSHGLDDTYILLQFNQWRLGNDYENISTNDPSEPLPLTFVKLPKANEKHTGKTMKLNLPITEYGISSENIEVSDEIYFEVLSKAMKIK